jgi:hypothetical protein
MHQEETRVSQVERAAHSCHVKIVNVTSNDLYVAQLKRRHGRPGPLDGWLAEVDAYDPAGWAHHLRHDGKPAERAAAAVDGVPAFLHTDPVEGRAGHLPGGLSDAQQPPEILIAAIEDVAPDPIRDRFSHDRPLCRREPVEALLSKACALVEERAAHRLDTAPPPFLGADEHGNAGGRCLGVQPARSCRGWYQADRQPGAWQ